jgi:hypothetical protein
VIPAKTGAGDVSAKHVAEVLGEAYGITSVMNLAASAGVISWELRTLSPRRIFAYARTAVGPLRQAAPGRLGSRAGAGQGLSPPDQVGHEPVEPVVQ